MNYNSDRAGAAPPPVILSEAKNPYPVPVILSEAKNPRPVPVILSSLRAGAGGGKAG